LKRCTGDAGAAASHIGGWASVLCAVHCLAAPLLGLVLPLGSAAPVLAEPLEAGLLVVATVTAATGAVSGYRRHRSAGVPVGVVLALGLLLGGWWLEGEGAWELVSRLLLLGGGLVLFFTLRHNRLLCRGCPRCAG
jgi:hypothetical protein